MPRPPAPALLVLLCALGQSACFGYAYHSRGGPPSYSRVAINKEPRRAVRWSYVWGLWTDEWTPVDCTKTDAAGACTSYVPVCDAGVGRVEVKLAPYSVPLMLVTLGMAVPMQVEAFCSAESLPVVGGP
jgi:hypothetical protein